MDLKICKTNINGAWHCCQNDRADLSKTSCSSKSLEGVEVKGEEI